MPPQITIAEALGKTGKIEKTLKAQVCHATPAIAFNAGPENNLIKLAVSDGSNSMTCLVYMTTLFEKLQDAAKQKLTVKLTNFRVKEQTAIISKDCQVSILARNTFKLTEEQITDAKLSIFAPVSPLKATKVMNDKKRVSIKAHIKKVYDINGSNRSRRLLIEDASGETTMTLWHPHSEKHEWEDVANITAYDCRCSKYFGGSLDTSSGTLIEIQQKQSITSDIIGEIIGMDITNDQSIEFVQEDEEDEETYKVKPNVELPPFNTLPLKAVITVTDGIVTALNIMHDNMDNQVDEELEDKLLG